MKMKLAAVAMAAVLAACGQAGGGGPAMTEEQLAAAIVDAEEVLGFGPEVIDNAVAGQLQVVAAEHPTLPPAEQEKIVAALRKEIEAGIPDLKRQITGFLVESYDEKELKVWYDYTNHPEHETIKAKFESLLLTSLAATDSAMLKARKEALVSAGIEGQTAPGEGHGAPPPPGAAPATPPATPPAKPN
jgi:hypothetical protein